jgi:diguanylate cyclase (GGDEF)-like protein/PAS domain S-box-containing protein
MEEKLKKGIIIFIIFLSVFFYFKMTVRADSHKKILILNSYSEELQWVKDIQEGIEDVLQYKNEVFLYYEYMDLKNNNGDMYIDMLYDFYKEKYKNTKFEMIICTDNDALEFMVKYGEDLFGKTPVIFCGVNNFTKDILKGKTNYTGIVEEINVKETILSMMYLQKDIKNVVVVYDNTTTGKINEELVRNSIVDLEHDINFYFYKDMQLKELLDEIYILDNNTTAILVIGQFKTDDGKYIPYEKNKNFISQFNVPIYVCWDFLLNEEVIGGKVLKGYDQGQSAADMAIKILDGQKIEDIQVKEEDISEFIFNYNALIKYGINIEELPSDYKIINKPFSLYDSYKMQIHIIIGVIIFLLILIGILIANIKRRIITEKELNRNYDELNVVYEELAAIEESLEMQYNEVQASEERYKLAVDGSNDIIWEYDFITKEHYISDKFEDLFGYKLTYNENLMVTFKKLIIEEDLDRVTTLFDEHLNRKSEYFKVECRVKNNFNEIKWVLIRGKALINDKNTPIKMSGSITDITDRKNIEEKNKFLAFYDQLTGLPNKQMFLDKVDDALLVNLQEGYKGVVFLVDIDNFKSINDTLGHDYGDEVLKYISKMFLNTLNTDEFICKLDADEFLILRLGVKSREDIDKFALNILDLFKKPISVKEKNIFITVSIGISIFLKDAFTKNELLMNSDIANYKAKEKGKNRYLFYNEDMSKEIIRKSQLIDGLRRAIDKSEFKLLYQPQVNLSDGRVENAEVLLRWNSDEFGNVSPGEFIPLAEQTELIISIGKWVLMNTCTQSKKWIDMGLYPITIAVNVSVAQLHQDDFLYELKNILERTKLPAECLEIEITESIVMSNIEENLKILNKIKDIGAKIALDDFGTGYSSLSYLRVLPINKLKLDKSFIDNIHLSSHDRTIVKCIISLAHEMNIIVVAEGVELKEQFDILKEMGCDKVQGYYFSKPISCDEFQLLIK